MTKFSQTPAYPEQRRKDGEMFIGSFIPNGMTTAVDASNSYVNSDVEDIVLFLRFSENLVITMTLAEVFKIKYGSLYAECNLFVVALDERLRLASNNRKLKLENNHVTRY